jgi:hypothetical protein
MSQLDQAYERVAPLGKIRAVAVVVETTQVVESADWLFGDYSSQAEAQREAQDFTKGGGSRVIHFYDDQGAHIDQIGSL